MPPDSTKPYVPIDCDFYDRLEELAVTRALCLVEFIDGDGRSRGITTRVRDVFSKSGEEFIDLDSGERIRLDRLIRINGHALP